MFKRKKKSKKLLKRLGGRPKLDKFIKKEKKAPETSSNIEEKKEEEKEKKIEKLEKIEIDEKPQTEENPEEEEEEETIDQKLKKLISKKNKTPSELTFMRLKQRRIKERIKKKKELSYRERIERLNKDLGNLPVHFDIPRVGPG